MLENYDISYKEITNQILVIDKKGYIADIESKLFNNAKGKHITSLHPFFSTIIGLLNNANEYYEFKCVNFNINDTNYSVDAVLHTNQDNKYAVFIFQDLTAQYIRYQKVAQNRNETEIKSQVLDFNNRLLQEKEQFKDNFITNFSHEIRLPVNTINGFLALLENTNLQQSQRYNLDIIKSTNGRLRAMINDILDISKIETNNFKAYNVRYNLIKELNILAEIYSKKCQEKGLQFHLNIDKECPKYVIADKYRLAQIASNILGNAIKFTNTGTITLDVKCTASIDDITSILFSVHDTGIGIAQDQIDNIFNSFYQISNGINSDGSGLGLAIVKNIVKALNGTIKITSKPNKGTTAQMLLDFKVDSNQIEEKNIAKNNAIIPNAPEILIAEPLKKEQDYILNCLGNNKKYNIKIVETGDQVIEALHTKSFDLVILNLKLPTMDGLDTARYIRLSDFSNFNNIPIIAMSSKASKEEETHCKNRRINSYIGKPYEKPELLRKVKYILQKKQAQ